MPLCPGAFHTLLGEISSTAVVSNLEPDLSAHPDIE